MFFLHIFWLRGLRFLNRIGSLMYIIVGKFLQGFLVIGADMLKGYIYHIRN